MTAPTEASLLCFLLGCEEEGTFSRWWIMSLSHEVKVRHTHGARVHHWMYMDHLKWNQFSWRIRAGCHNGFYLTPINTCIDFLAELNLAGTEREKVPHTHRHVSDAATNVAKRWRLKIHLDFLRPAAQLHMQMRCCECFMKRKSCNRKTWFPLSVFAQ